MTKKTKALLRRTAGIFCLGGILLAAGSFTSCSEDKDTVEEYSDWQAKNEAYWNSLYTATQQKIKNGDTSWRTILNYTFQNQKNDSKTPSTYGPEDYIIVHVEAAGTETKSPLYSDSVSVHYMGRMIPSTTYTSGLIFDKSWSSETFNAATSRPAHFLTQGVVDGFATALQSMHRGDHWTVYIPYQLGYGRQGQGQVQAYSVLIFDLRLVDFAHPGRKLKDK
jgi:peptidyl-prolyl cis-trans isomerase